jgi:hypothetical protein
MSDPTKKSIVINKSFLSANDSLNSSNIQAKKSKKNTRALSEEIIKPNKLKKMLLDKINAKRKADQTSSTSSTVGGGSSGGGMKRGDTLDISKETRLFSSEFKKSLDFLDSYIGQKRDDKHKNKNNTLKKQNTSTSLNTDILKSIHNNNNNNHNHTNNNNNNNAANSHVSYPANNIHQSIQTQAYIAKPIQPTQITQTIAPIVHQSRHQPAPLFQKIQLQIPNKSPHITPHNISSNMVPKINLAIGKPVNQSLVYTELPPELQNFTPPVYSISSPSYSPLPSPSMQLPPPLSLDTLPPLEQHTNFVIGPSIKTGDDIDLGEMREIREIGEMDNAKYENVDISSTSLFPSSSTFSPVKLSDDAPYGCLKGGKKPTFRTYNKTIKNNLRFSGDDDSNSDSLYSDRQTKLKELQNKHNKKTSSRDNKKLNLNLNSNSLGNDNDGEDNNGGEHPGDSSDDSDSDENKNKHNLRKTKIRRHLRKTITKKFKLGKQPGNIVGVLIKNNDTRKNIQKEHGLLKNKQLADVKKYLVEKNLIKIGSTAPPGVIRNIYEASMLAGELENVGKGVGLHNFLEDKKSW